MYKISSSKPNKFLPQKKKNRSSITMGRNELIHVVLLILIVFGKTSEAVVKLPANITVPAVLMFGDSIVDTGNNNNMVTVSKCNFPPYGRDLPGGMPTGRFSDGKVPSDMLAEELGIKEYLPAYLDPNLQPNDLLTGVNFASGGCGYDPLTSKIEMAITLAGQLELFKEYISKLQNMVGEDRTNFILANSLFAVVAGSNDIANTYYLSRARESEYDIHTYTDLLITSASNFFTDLYKLGARRLIIFNAPPLGCLPSLRTIAGGPGRECAREYNQGALLYNAKLSAELDSLNQKYPDAKMVNLDIYNPLLEIIQNPDKYGFEVVNKGCCGTGNIEVVFLCAGTKSLSCTDASKYVFWDSYHPTEKTYSILVPQLIQRYIGRFF